MYNKLIKCNWTGTKGSLKPFTGRSENQYKYAQIRSNRMKTCLHYKFNLNLFSIVTLYFEEACQFQLD